MDVANRGAATTCMTLPELYICMMYVILAVWPPGLLSHCHTICKHIRHTNMINIMILCSVQNTIY